jgi:hypothetical protein
MKKTLEYLQKIKKEVDLFWSLEISERLFLIHEKALFIEKWWEYYFSLTVMETDDYLNTTIKIGTFVSIHSLADRIYKWSQKSIEYQKWWRVHLIGLLRNHITHWDKDFYLPWWWWDEEWLSRLQMVHIEDIDTIEWLNKWRNVFEETNKEDWWDEEWATSSKNQIIQDALHIYKNDIEKIDNELYEMVSIYFNSFLK